MDPDEAERRDYDRTLRLVQVTQLLYQYPGGIRARRLADLCGVNIRTTYRDLDALSSSSDFHIWQDGGLWGVDRADFLPPLKLTRLEAMALFLGARLVFRYSDERDPAIESAFGKLAAILPITVARHVTETVRFMRDRPESPDYARVFSILAEAWATGHRVRIWYAGAGDGAAAVQERLVEPYFMEPSPIGHSCYLIAHCHHAGGMRTFKLERIRQIELTDQSYEIPADFDVNQYFKSSWGIASDDEVKVVLRFTPRAATRVLECRWHPSQEIQQLENGALEFSVTVAGTMEITPWILSWGAEAEVLAPADLREKIARIARRMADCYDPAPLQVGPFDTAADRANYLIPS